MALEAMAEMMVAVAAVVAMVGIMMMPVEAAMSAEIRRMAAERSMAGRAMCAATGERIAVIAERDGDKHRGRDERLSRHREMERSHGAHYRRLSGQIRARAAVNRRHS